MSHSRSLGLAVLLLCGACQSGSGSSGGAPGTKAASTAPATSGATTAPGTSGSVANLPAVSGPDRYVYVGSTGPLLVDPATLLSIDPRTGALAAVGTDAMIDGPNALTVDPGRHFIVGLFGNAPGTGAAAAFKIDHSGPWSVEVGDAPTQGTGVLPWMLAFSAPDRFVAIDYNGDIGSFDFIPQTGSVGLAGQVSTPVTTPVYYCPISFAVAGSFVYHTWLDLSQGMPIPGGFQTTPATPSHLFVARIEPNGQLTAGASTQL